MISYAVALALLGFALLLFSGLAWFRRLRRVAIPDSRIAFQFLWLLAALLGVASFFASDGGWLSGIIGGVAALGGITLLLLHALRKQGVGNTISVGDQIPAFTALDGEGNSFDSASVAGSPVLLKFFRGHW